LAAVAAMIPPGKVVADLGSDHGYLPVYLVTEKNSPLVLATDKSQACLEKTHEILELFNLSSKIELRFGDGLYALKKSDCPETVVIAGMGARSIARILSQGGEILSRVECLVLQSMGDEHLLRRWLMARRWRFTGEKLAFERGFYYVVMQVEPGKQAYLTPTELEIGPKLIEDSDPLLVPYLEHKISYFITVIEKLERGTSAKTRKRLRYYREKVKKFEEVLAIVREGEERNRDNRTVGAFLPGPGE